MLSLSKLTSSSSTSNYFTAEIEEDNDYYTRSQPKVIKDQDIINSIQTDDQISSQTFNQDHNQSIEQTQRLTTSNLNQSTTYYRGKISQDLSIDNLPIGKERFKNLLDGVIKNNKDKIMQEFKHKDRTSGVDMTFSAPKSLSILSQVIQNNQRTNSIQNIERSINADLTQNTEQGKAQTIIQIHNQAVNKTLDYVEKNFIQTQVRTGSSSNIDSTVQLHKTQKSLFAVFRHDTSRNLDPQLHSHAIVINITQRDKEPKFRSTELKQIFENKMLLGAIYRSELANQLIKQGYQIEQTHIDGRFEIKGFPQDLLDKFSTRRKDIEAKLEELNKDDAKTSAKVALETRKAKVDVSRDILQKQWQEVIKDYDLTGLRINVNQNQNNTKQSLRQSSHTNAAIQTPARTTKEIINHSIDILTDKESVFTKTDLLKLSLTNYIEQGVTIDKLENTIETMIKDRDILQISQSYQNKSINNNTGNNKKSNKNNNNNQELYLTTKEEIKREIDIVNHLDNSQVKPLYSPQELTEITTTEHDKQEDYQYSSRDGSINKDNESITAIQNQYSLLTRGQQQALKHILTSRENIIGIQGSAGTGKTYMLNLVRQILEKKEYEFIALAPSVSATSLLKDDAKIQNCNTLQHFLTKYSEYSKHSTLQDGQNLDQLTLKSFKNKVIILDEASLVSNKQMLALLNITKALNVRLILQGDSKQLSAVQAGKPFKILQQSGMKTVVMNDILRQQNPDLKETVNLLTTNQDNIKLALQKLDSNIFEVSNQTDQAQNHITNNTNPHILSYIKEDPNKEQSHKLEEKRQEDNHSTKEKISNKVLDIYFSLSQKERNNSLILTSANETRQEINQAVRNELIKRNELTENTNSTFETLKVKNLSSQEKTLPINYSKDDVVIFRKDVASNYHNNKITIAKNQEYKVANRENNVITLESQKNNINQGNKTRNRQIQINLTEINTDNLDIYTKEEKEVLKNELIRFTRNDKKHNLINSHTARVIEIKNNKQTITLQLTNKTRNNKVTINKQDLKHFDYAYCSTAYSAQGKTADNVIAVLESYRKNLTNQQTFYVQISRARHNAFLITDDKTKLQATLEQKTGQKFSVLEREKTEKSQEIMQNTTQKEQKSIESVENDI